MTHTHYYEIDVHLTPPQHAAVGRLRASVETVTLAAYEQARLAQRGTAVSIAAVLGGADHPDRSPEGEARALHERVLPDVPLGVLLGAVTAFRHRLVGLGEARVLADVPPVGGLTSFAGPGWLTPAPPLGVRLLGVPGVVEADLHLLPAWARAVIERDYGDVGSAPEVDVRGATLTGWAGLEDLREARATLELEFEWDAYETGLLAPLWEDEGELSPRRRAVAPLLRRGTAICSSARRP